MLRICTPFALALTVVVLSSVPAAQPAPPVAADRVVDSIGLNVHLHYTDTPYGDFNMVRTRLAELGVRHLRDGLIVTTFEPYYERHNALGAAGIKTVFIAPAAISDDDLRRYPSRMSNVFEAFEAPNEFDLNGGANWPAGLRQSLAQLHALKSVPGLERFPIYGPSLTSEAAFAALGDVGGLVDAANIHNYFAGHHPGTPGWGPGGYGSIAWNVALALRSAPGKPVVSTETGYWDDPAVADSVPAGIVARYLPRLILEQLRAGILRTYIYELLDDQRSGVTGASGYGLVRADGTPKPAFRALAAMIRLFTDPGPVLPPAAIDYSVSGGDDTVRRQLFVKQDGSLLPALWVEREGYDVGARRPIGVAAQPVTVALPQSFALLKTYHWRDDGSVAERTDGAGQASVALQVDDALTVLEFELRGAARAPRNVHILP